MKIFFLLIKVLLSALLLGYFASKFDLPSLFKVIHSPSGLSALLVGALFILFQALVGGGRLPYLLKLHHESIGFFDSLRIWFIGSFFSQVLISFVGGDAMRIWSLRRLQIPLRIASSAIFLDRVIGFIALMLLFLIGLPLILALIKTPVLRVNLIFLAVLSVTAIFTFFLLGKLPIKIREHKRLGFLFELISSSHRLSNSYKYSAYSLFLSLLLQLANGLAIYFIFRVYGVDTDPLLTIALAIPPMLMAALPISFAGWGIRESVMITIFELLGLPPEKILLTSITLGLSTLLSSLPGIFLFFFERQHEAMPKIA